MARFTKSPSAVRVKVEKSRKRAELGAIRVEIKRSERLKTVLAIPRSCLMTNSSRWSNAVCNSRRRDRVRHNRGGHARFELEVRFAASFAAKVASRFHRIDRIEFVQGPIAAAVTANEKKEIAATTVGSGPKRSESTPRNHREYGAGTVALPRMKR